MCVLLPHGNLRSCILNNLQPEEAINYNVSAGKADNGQDHTSGDAVKAPSFISIRSNKICSYGNDYTEAGYDTCVELEHAVQSGDWPVPSDGRPRMVREKGILISCLVTLM